MAELVLEPFEGHAGLTEALSACQGLLEGAALDPLVNDPVWLEAYARSFVPSGALFGWTAHTAGGEPVALLPLRLEPRRGPLALLRALHAADGSFDSDYLELWIRPGHERPVLDALVDALLRTKRVDALVLANVPADSRTLGPLRALLAERRLAARERLGDCLAAPLPGDFEAYVAGLRSRMRSKVRQALRRADEAGARFAWCDAPEELEGHLEGLFELHAKRWDEAGEAGSFALPERRAFYGRLAPALLTAGRLRFARLDLDGRAVAYQFGASAGGTYYQMQEGFDPEAGLPRAGNALRAHTIRELIATGHRSYDFMAGDSAHKRSWGGEPRPTVTLAFGLPRWRARLAYGLRALKDRRG